jgi:glycosyltransferase 2 family protein
MRRLAIGFLVGGAALTAWLIFKIGAPMIGKALLTAGWTGLLTISGFHLIATALMGLAWWGLQRIGRPWVFIWGRLVRDAGSEVLPLSQIGGYVLGARAVIVQGVAGVSVAAATAVDATLEFGAQITYAALGLILIASISPPSLFATFILAILCLAVAAAIAGLALALVKARRDWDLPARLAGRLADGRFGGAFGRAAAVQAEINRLLQWKRVWPSYLLHLGAWITSGVEAWLALWLMGISLSFPAILAMESLVYATRAVAFLVPNAIGVQEGAYIVLGGAFGLTPEFALGLSLLKRGRDLALGIPALITWQLSEGQRRWIASNPVVAAIASDQLSEERTGPAPRLRARGEND